MQLACIPGLAGPPRLRSLCPPITANRVMIVYCPTGWKSSFYQAYDADGEAVSYAFLLEK
ncbi:hypothetical protein DX928_14315 [Bacillus swezeyi]|uniref:Uncharacterized protein n=1 Tax=Bacillus swezeyi TaxID=1925020 RepID=A0A5M8RXX0_9BACI|nr:hypothetical protein DX927_07300 [Bacillus swezeyi]KAA6475161.1 hypothetical protein DX928_14315 [Bacillus swezeyi]